MGWVAGEGGGLDPVGMVRSDWILVQFARTACRICNGLDWGVRNRHVMDPSWNRGASVLMSCLQCAFGRPRGGAREAVGQSGVKFRQEAVVEISTQEGLRPPPISYHLPQSRSYPSQPGSPQAPPTLPGRCNPWWVHLRVRTSRALFTTPRGAWRAEGPRQMLV